MDTALYSKHWYVNNNNLFQLHRCEFMAWYKKKKMELNLGHLPGRISKTIAGSHLFVRLEPPQQWQMLLGLFGIILQKHFEENLKFGSECNPLFNWHFGVHEKYSTMKRSPQFESKVLNILQWFYLHFRILLLLQKWRFVRKKELSTHIMYENTIWTEWS